MAAVRLGFIVLVLALFTLVMMPIQMLAIRQNWPIARRIPYYWQRLARSLIGLRVTVEGRPAEPPLLIATNHVSWLDITTLGSVLPVSFIAKSEVSGWPVVRTLARLQRTVFVDRTRRQQAGAATEAIAQRLGRGDTMVLFAEGTTGDGNQVLPFRSALIGAAGAVAGPGPTTVQPVAIVYTRRSGLPVGRADNPDIAWYGGMDLVPHFRRLLGSGPIDAVVSFGEPIAFDAERDRKRVAESCFRSVRAMVETVKRRPASPNRHPRAIFSPRAKDAKGTLVLAPGYCTGASQGELRDPGA